MGRKFRRIWIVALMMAVSGLTLPGGPAFLGAQPPSQLPATTPPIDAVFVRQGDFAAALSSILGLTDGRNELQAEDALVSLGIVPRNGWISDDPLTPDVIVDLEAATAYAADANLLPFSRDEAIARFVAVVEESGVLIGPEPGALGYASNGPAIYQGQSDINQYYMSEGPPVITYYTPPPAYQYLYSWVPYSFWYGGTPFAGYYILRDHDRHRGHRRYVSSTWGGGANHPYAAGEHYRGSRGMQIHTGNRRLEPRQRNHEGHGSMFPSAALSRNGRSVTNGRGAPVPTRSSERPGRNLRDGHPYPRSAGPSIGAEGRFSMPRTPHQISPAPSSAVRPGNHFMEGFHRQTRIGPSGSASRHGFGDRGYAHFKR